MEYDSNLMSDNKKEEINRWDIIKSYFDKQHLQRLVRHQIESYNDFVNNQIQKTIDMFNPVYVHSIHYKHLELDIYSLDMSISFENFRIYRPQIHENNGAMKLMFPQEARLRNFTYASVMTIDLNIKITHRYGENYSNSETFYKTLPNIHIGKLPIMLKSDICILKQHNHLNPDITGECKMDTGGYFIINGSEKTVIPQERAAENRIYCFNVKKNNNKWSYAAEIKSVPDFKCISPKQIKIMIASKNNGFGCPLYINIPRIKHPIPLFILFRALGIISDEAICDIIILNKNDKKTKRMLFGLKASIVDANKYMTQEDGIQYITNLAMFTPINMEKEKGARKKREFTLNVLTNDLFPHCRTENQKIKFLGYMTNQLMQTSFQWIKPCDRDSYTNKRIDLTGTLLNNLFRNYFNKLVKDMQKQIVREMNNGSWKSTDDYHNIINKTNIYKIIKSTTIANGIKRALATGDFGIKHTNSNKVGVAQVLNRLTYISSLSHLRRINTPIDKSGKLIPPRKLHNSQWGKICPAETPEGGSVGVVKNLSYMAHITIKSNTEPITDLIKKFITPIDELTPMELYEKVKVFINGCWIGITEKAIELYKFLKVKKGNGIINIYTSIIFDIKKKEIRVCNDGGRITRPVLKVRNNKLIITPEIIDKLNKKELSWEDLLVSYIIDESVLEYLDADEETTSLVAIDPKRLTREEKYSPKYTHCEIHPSTIFGILASCIPYPEHNQSPRNTYQCAMGKQAMGMFVSNFDKRMDKTAYVQTYSMRPLVDTRIMNFINLHKIPSGEMVMVAIMTYTGYNQEDSIMFNEESVDRGLFSATVYHTEKDEDKKIHGDEEIRCKPDKNKTKGMKFANYDKLNTRGVMEENSLIENKDIVIGKVIPIKEARNDHTKIIKYRDQSRIYRTKEDTYIDKNYINRNGDGYTFAKIRVRAYRKPKIGDKFSSRHGQKGTIGNIVPASDMPFTENGLRPDIIINPHAIPSRMTIGQLKETLLGKVLLELGGFGDGTSFGDFTVKEITNILLDLGKEKNGNQIMYNGMTGQQIETSVFFGPAFYQRLKHMVADKCHSRSIGPMVVLTRQPAEGRARDGGLRFGEMERDCMISHGASRFTQDRIYYASDKFKVPICKKCGLIAIYNDEKHKHLCTTCENRTDFAIVNIPYACKLLTQELISMNIAPRFITE